MEHNKNGILALIVLFVGLAFLLSVWFIIYGHGLRKSTHMSTFFLRFHVKPF